MRYWLGHYNSQKKSNDGMFAGLIFVGLVVCSIWFLTSNFDYFRKISELDLVLYCFLFWFTVYIFSIFYFGYHKKKVLKKKLLDASNNDGFWNEKEIIDQTKVVYTQLKSAWEKLNMSSVKNNLDKKLYERYEHHVNEILRNKVLLPSYSDFIKANIIKISDYKNDLKDSCVVEVVTKKSCDWYFFERINHKWILTNVTQGKSFFDYLFVGFSKSENSN